MNSKKSILKIENKLSKIPQIYNLYCDKKKMTNNIVLIKDESRLIDLNKYQNCNNELFTFSINQGKNKFLLNKTMMGDLELENYNNDKSTFEKQNISNNIIFQGKVDITNNLILNEKNIFFKPKANVCIGKDKILYLKNSRIYFEGLKDNSTYISGCNEVGGSLIIENSSLNIDSLKISKLNALI